MEIEVGEWGRWWIFGAERFLMCNLARCVGFRRSIEMVSVRLLVKCLAACSVYKDSVG